MDSALRRTQAVIMPQNRCENTAFALRKPLLCRKVGAKTQRGAHAKPPENSKVARAPAAQSEPGPSKQPAQTTQPHTEPPTKPRA
ncbi:hypothetical protein ACRALDRAFT_210187 [Sodiomyces alcalophilus JCM 7366]|uniref:uncharacterized protein n=1 Tax=Sodiomyces alcalophilus JCM 7366 TaxID=591952 RepID=UPI0039B5058F